MRQKLFAIFLMALFSVLAVAAMAGHHGDHGMRAPKAPRAPMAPDTPRDFCGQEMGRHFGGAGKLLHLADKLELTKKQIAEIKGKMEKNGLDHIDRQAELKKAKLKLRYLKMNDAPENKILSAIEKVGRMKTEMKKEKYINRNAIKSVLTETQQEKLKELKKEYRGKCKPGGKGFRGRGHDEGSYFEDEAESDTYGLEPPQSTENWEY